VFIPDNSSQSFIETLCGGVASLGEHVLLTHGIAIRYQTAIRRRTDENKGVIAFRQRTQGESATRRTGNRSPTLFSISLQAFDLEQRDIRPYDIAGSV
jgi:hypothetical protein